MTDIKRLLLATAARNEFLTKELLHLLDLLQNHGLSPIPVKGPVLAQRLHGDIALRHFDDLDILVHPRDVRTAGDLLRSNNYAPQLELTGPQRRAHINAGWEYALQNTQKNCVVELSSGIAPRHFTSSLPQQELRSGLVKVIVQGKPVQALSPENLLLLLCVHGAKHGWERLGWIVDVASLLSTQELNWVIILKRARKHGASRMLLLGLELTRKVARATLPEEAKAAIARDPQARMLADEVAERLADLASTGRAPHKKLPFHLRARERLRDRLRYLMLLAITPSYGDWDAVPLPSKLFWLYYAIRPFRLLYKATQRGSCGTKTTRIRQDHDTQEQCTNRSKQ